MIDFSCEQCGKIFQRSESRVRWDSLGRKRKFCSKECSVLGRKSKPIEVSCHACKKVFFRKKKDIGLSGRVFCSKSCTGLYLMERIRQGMVRRKRKFKSCFLCKKEVDAHGRKYCRACWQLEHGKIPMRKKGSTLQDIRKVHHHSLYVMKDAPKVCKNCGYSKYVEMCHIRPVSSFSADALWGEINEPTNLVLLCRNCHWEFDHGELELVSHTRGWT